MELIKDLKQLDITRHSRILAVFAHPDDETAFSAVLLKRLVDIGSAIRFITLTNGEKSSLRYGLEPNDDLSVAREKEMKTIHKMMGTSDYKLSKFIDGEIEANSERVKTYLSNEMELFRPELVVTLEPNGISGHFDHIATTTIVQQLQSLGKYKIIYSTVSNRFKLSKTVDQKILRNGGKIRPMPPQFYIKLNPGEVLYKLEAFRKHRTQFNLTLRPAMINFIIKWGRRDLLTKEFFSIS